MTPSQRGFCKYTFRDYTGYIIAPWTSSVGHDVVTIRHGAAVPPWRDRDIHLHTDSEEYYFLVQGELQVLVPHGMLTVKPREVLMIEPYRAARGGWWHRAYRALCAAHAGDGGPAGGGQNTG